jgi:hypothetical protein
MTMKLPYPFESAQDVKPDAMGRIALVDGDGVTLVHVPLETAYALTPERSSSSGCSGYGFSFGYSCDSGYDSSDGDGCGSNYGDGSGDSEGHGSGCYGYNFGYDCGSGCFGYSFRGGSDESGLSI